MLSSMTVSNIIIEHFMDADAPRSKWWDGELREYHRSWDLLMSVVDKIEKIYETKDRLPSFQISALSVWFYLPDFDDKTDIDLQQHFTPTAFYEVAGCHSTAPEKVKFDTKIEALYYVVVKFIEWYNENN